MAETEFSEETESPLERPVADNKAEPAAEKPPEEKSVSLPGAKTEKDSEVGKEMAASETLQQSEQAKDSIEGEGLLAALAPRDTSVTLASIMPVAFDVNDIRVLSFKLVLELTDDQSAQVIREALPVYEQIMVATVERFLQRKFYNDILYVKEKLQRRLQKDFNKKLTGDGRIKKVKFTDFLIQ